MLASQCFRSRRCLALLTSVGVSLVAAPVALAEDVPSYSFAGPVFGLAAAPDGSLLAADAGAGIVELRKAAGSLVVALPGVSDVAPIGRGNMWAITGIGEGDAAQKLFRVSRGSVREVADLWAFEVEMNPDGSEEPDSNPFDVAALTGGSALVADAGANDLLIVDATGHIDWIATLPVEPESTDNLKSLAGCPAGPPNFCNLPPVIPTQAVATSVAIGPDGAYYVGELKGFPAPTGASRVWRIEPGTRHAECGSSPACTVVADGFTSIIDLAFGPDGMLYVVEFDEASWAAVEIFGNPTGGTVNACDPRSGSCFEVATDLPVPSAVAIDKDGTVYATINTLGGAQVIALP